MEFVTLPDVFDSYGHVSVAGSMFSDEFRDEEVNMELRLSPRFDSSIDTFKG